MKNRILLLIWFILLALAAVFTGAWVYAVLLLLSALAVVAFLLLGFFCGKKITMKLKLPKAAEQDGIWKGKLQIANESVLPVFLGKGSLHLENHFTGEQMELPFSFSLKGRGKKAIDFQGKSQWCGCIYATLHTWRSYDFFGLAGQKRKAGLSACTVVMPCEQKEDFRFLTKEGFDMESFRYSGARPGDDPGETFDIREYQEGDSIRQIHWKLTGKKVLGVGDASGMFPIDSATGTYEAGMITQYDELAGDRLPCATVTDLLPEVLSAGEAAGELTATGALFMDPSGVLRAGIPLCPPEGDAGTGMVATNSVAPRTGNVSAGTSIFAMVVLEKPLANAHEELDLVTTPAGDAVAMVHCNNGASELGT